MGVRVSQLSNMTKEERRSYRIKNQMEKVIFVKEQVKYIDKYLILK